MIDLGIKKFKREHPEADAWTIRQFKENAHKTYDPKKIEARPKPTKYEPQIKQPLYVPPGLTNHQRHIFRRDVRNKLKELKNAKPTN